MGSLGYKQLYKFYKTSEKSSDLSSEVSMKYSFLRDPVPFRSLMPPNVEQEMIGDFTFNSANISFMAFIENIA